MPTDSRPDKGKGKSKKKFESKSKQSNSGHKGGGGGGGSKGNHKGGGPKGSGNARKNNSNADNNSRKETQEEKKRELRNRPQIFLTPEKKASLTYILSQMKDKSFDENGNKSNGHDFQKKYQSNLLGNAVAKAEAAATSSASAKSVRSNNNQTKSRTAIDEDSFDHIYSLSVDPELDKQLQNELKKKETDPRYVHMQHYRRSLPAYDCSLDIINIINKNQVVVICGETGSGKTTQVGQYVLDDFIQKGIGSSCKILCTQPRRISAISVAERVAEERAEAIGKSIGYSIRLESRIPSRTAGTILFVTTGVVFQYLKEDPNLSRVSMVIVDECHERDILTDFLMAILKDLVQKRKDLKVILMSATLNAKKFADYFSFGDKKCPIFTIPGLCYPVTELYLEDVIAKTKFNFQPARNRVSFNGKPNPKQDQKLREFERWIHPHIKKLEQSKSPNYPKEAIRELLKPESEEINLDLIQALIEHICNTDSKGNGAILVFMPGWDTISSLIRQLQGCGKFHYSKYLVIPLHSLVPSVNQREVFNKPPPGKRKIIVATNIAETSITIDDVVHVIDTGKIKINNFDVKKNMETLDLEWVSLANAKQRKGRAGRVQEGTCYHLYTRARESELEEFKKPEILRKGLAEVVLQIKLLKLGNAGPFLKKILDTPSEKAVELGVTRLFSLNALDSEENLTPLGFHLANLPMDPQTAKMILFGAIFSCIDPICSIAASLSFKDAFYIPMGQEKKVDLVRKELSEGMKSDHVVTVRAIEGYEKAKARGTERDYCYKNYLSTSNINMLLNLKSQFANYLYKMRFLSTPDYKDEESNKNSKNLGIITAITASGLYPNVAQIKMKGKKSPYPVVYTEEDGNVSIHPKSVNNREVTFECPFLVYHQKMKSSMIYLYDTTMVSPFPLVFFGGNLIWQREKGAGGTLLIDNGRIRFGCQEQAVFSIVDSLRKELDKFLECKVNNPGPTNWSELSKEGILLKAVIQLITTEYRMLMNTEDDDDDDSEGSTSDGD